MAERLVQLAEKKERCRQLTVSVHHIGCGHDTGDSVLLVPDEDEAGGFQCAEHIDQLLVIPGLVSADDGVRETRRRTGVARLSDRLPGHRAPQRVRAGKLGEVISPWLARSASIRWLMRWPRLLAAHSASRSRTEISTGSLASARLRASFRNS